jgi:hypothetical protein
MAARPSKAVYEMQTAIYFRKLAVPDIIAEITHLLFRTPGLSQITITHMDYKHLVHTLVTLSKFHTY